jgi:molybdate transport system regulatory protein
MPSQKTKTKSLAVRSKVWLEAEGKPIMGEGRMDMLEAIQRYGSILQASKATGVSYRKIRGAIHDMEGALGVVLVRSYRGGDHGGGASLTPEALGLMRCFRQLNHGFQDALDTRFEEIAN